MKLKKRKTHPNIERKVYDLLSNTSSARWHDIDKIISLTGLKAGNVFRIVNESGKFVLSFDSKRRPVFATRERYSKEEPFLRRLIDALTDKIN